MRDAWPVIWVLGITQIIGYGSVSVSFSLLMEPLQQALGASKSATVGAFSFALVIAGLCATYVRQEYACLLKGTLLSDGVRGRPGIAQARTKRPPSGR